MLIALVGIALLIFSSIINGYALSVLWGWFMVPIFSLPALNVPEAIAVAMVAGFLTHQFNTNDDSNSEFIEAVVKGFFIVVARAAITIGTGYVLLMFM